MNASPWPSIAEWEETLPEREPDRLIAHTALYKRHNDRLETIHDATRTKAERLVARG